MLIYQRVYIYTYTPFHKPSPLLSSTARASRCRRPVPRSPATSPPPTWPGLDVHGTWGPSKTLGKFRKKICYKWFRMDVFSCFFHKKFIYKSLHGGLNRNWLGNSSKSLNEMIRNGGLELGKSSMNLGTSAINGDLELVKSMKTSYRRYINGTYQL